MFDQRLILSNLSFLSIHVKCSGRGADIRIGLFDCETSGKLTWNMSKTNTNSRPV